jgi:hypothetical protein
VFRIKNRIILFSLLLLIFLMIFSNVAYAVTQCEVDKIKQSLRKMLYNFYSNPNSVSFTIVDVKDLLLFYLSIDSNQVTTDCSVLGTKSNKAIFDIINIGNNVTDNIPKCSDGTNYGQCTAKKPKYCYAGAIYEKCGICGCPENSVCGKSNKCERVTQNIECHKDIDCGANKFVGDYYCSFNSIYKNMINRTCLNPGTVNSRCIEGNSSVWLNYCNPNLNQICKNGLSTCELNITDNPPTVSITATPTTVSKGQDFNVTVTGTDDIGLTAIWWWAVDSTDTEFNKAHWHSCKNTTYCSKSWLVNTDAVGTIKLGANSRDISYPVTGEPHQASEGAGIDYTTIIVGTINVTGGPPDLIISDFKSYTGITDKYVTINATIKNIGGSPTVGNLCDSLYVETLNARGFCGAKLNPGETRIIQSDFALPAPGTYKIRADTDYGRSITESNELNNVIWKTVTITDQYSEQYSKLNTDLSISDIDVQLPATSSQRTKVYVTSKNSGNIDTGQYWVYVKVTNIGTGKTTTVQRLAPVVEPGSTYNTFYGDAGINDYGTYKVEAFVDNNLYGRSYVDESNEDNNYMTKTVNYGTINVTNSCTDTDGGINYGAIGNSTGYNSDFSQYRTVLEYCKNSTTLYETWCTSDNRVNGAYYNCPAGCTTGACANTTTFSNSVNLLNLSILYGNLTVEYSKNFDTCVHLVGERFEKTSNYNFYCKEGENINVSQYMWNFNLVVGNKYKLCHGNNYNVCSKLKTLVNLTPLTASCVDFDNGDNIFVASYAKKGSQKQYDKCGTSGQNYEIIEGVCRNGQLSGIPHSCPSGSKCVNVRYEPAVNAYLGACTNQTNETLSATPDLIVNSMTFNPSNPTSSDLIRINISVKNIGNVTSGNSVLQIDYNPGWYTRLSVPSLISGASFSGLLSWNLAANYYTFTASADKDNNVFEQNENNNVLVKNILVSASLNQSNNYTNQS